MDNFTPLHNESQSGGFNGSQSEFDRIVSNSRNLDQNLKMQLEKNRGLIEKLFPNKLHKLIDDKNRILMTTSLDFRLSLFKLANEFRFEATKDKLDVYLKAYKGKNRTELSNYITTLLNELNLKLHGLEKKALKDFQDMYQFIETIPLDSSKAKYYSHIDARETAYLKMTTTLWLHFEKIASEHLGESLEDLF